MPNFTDPYGATGQIVDGEFVPYASEEDAQAMRVSSGFEPPKQTSDDAGDGMSVKAIKARLDKLGVKYDSKARKTDLEALLAQASTQQNEEEDEE